MINEFEFFKPSAPLNEEINMRSVFEVFELDSFKGDWAKISKEQIHAILDRFTQYNKVPSLAILSSVMSAVIKNFNVTQETPMKDVIALCYILFMTDTFGTEALIEKIEMGIKIDNTFRYFSEMEVTAPLRFVDATKSKLDNETIYAVLIERWNFNVIVEISDEDYQKWIKKEIPKIHAFVAGADAVKGLLGDFKLE